MPIVEKLDVSVYEQRRQLLCSNLLKKYPDAHQPIVVLFAGFERDSKIFSQESSFYYFTGVEDPACAVIIDCISYKTIFFTPNFGKEREKWVLTDVAIESDPRQFGFDDICYLGDACKGYQCHPFFTRNQYSNLLQHLECAAGNKRVIFTINPADGGDAYIEQRFIIQRIVGMNNNVGQLLIDISADIARIRRKKSQQELEFLYKAVEITMQAHSDIAPMIAQVQTEYQLQALIEYIFTSMGGSVAFASIVGSGKNSAVLHYNQNNNVLQQGDLVVVDIGARYNYYCADLTRTYPINGTFNDRQKKLYEIVLATQEYIADLARPGYWLSNTKEPDKSLHHLAKGFLKKEGLDDYFIHGIGHFLGLDVHDVGDYTDPLAPGDVITIEPGVYFLEEKIGIRIEDNYWITQEGAVCLSEQLPKDSVAIENMMKNHAQ